MQNPKEICIIGYTPPSKYLLSIVVFIFVHNHHQQILSIKGKFIK